MPENLDAIKEAYQRGILPEDLKPAFEEAVKRGIISVGAPPEQPNFVQRAINTVSGKGRRDESIGEFTTGFDLPNPMKTAAGVLFSTNEQQISDILKEQIPNAEFNKDRFGNLLVKAPGRDWEYINKPGLTPRDVANSIAQLSVFLKGGKLAGGVTAGASLPIRAAGQAATAGGISVGMDAASTAAGSQQGVDLPKAAVVAAAGGSAEMLAPIFSQLMRFTTGSGRIPTVYEARLKMADLGFSPKDLTDETVQKFIEISRRAATPEAAMRYAEAQGLPVPVPLTKGQTTMLARDQMFEDMATKGAYGEGAERIMRGQAQMQDEALRANIPAIQQRIGGEGMRAQRGSAGQAVQEDLSRRAQGLNKVVGKQYDIARATTGEAPASVGESIYVKIYDSVADYMPHAPGAAKELETFKKLVAKPPTTQKSMILGPDGQPIQNLNINEGFNPTEIKSLYDWRRKITKLSENAKDRTEAAAFKSMKSAFDDSMDDAMMTALESGDKSAVEAWRSAIKARRAYGKVFESGDLVEKLIEKESGQFKIVPEAASNAIFGVSETQLISRPELARELKKMQVILSPENWNALREEAFLRLAQRGEAGAFQGGQRQFSGVNLKKAVDDMRTKNPEVWHTLFNDQEKALISQFANVAARVTNPVRGGQNFSNTASALSNIVQKVGETLLTGTKGQAFLSRIFPSVYEGLMIGPAAQAAKGGLPLRQLPPGIAGGAGGGMAFEGAQ